MNPSAETLAEAFVRCRDMDASLAERLAAYSDAVRTTIPAYSDAVERLVGRWSASGVGSTAPQPGEPMPGFVLPDETGKLVTLEGALAQGPVAITFHRGHWCPWCRISATALANVHGSLVQTGGQVLAIMPERQRFTAEFKTRTHSPFPVLSDVDNGYALTLNLVVRLGPDLEHLLASLGHALPDYQGNDAWYLPIPATFVVARNGLVTARFIDPDFRRRMAVEELVAALEAARRVH